MLKEYGDVLIGVSVLLYIHLVKSGICIRIFGEFEKDSSGRKDGLSIPRPFLRIYKRR